MLPNAIAMLLLTCTLWEEGRLGWAGWPVGGGWRAKTKLALRRTTFVHSFTFALLCFAPRTFQSPNDFLCLPFRCNFELIIHLPQLHCKCCSRFLIVQFRFLYPHNAQRELPCRVNKTSIKTKLQPSPSTHNYHHGDQIQIWRYAHRGHLLRYDRRWARDWNSCGHC